MKKIISLFMVVAICVAFAACGSGGKEVELTTSNISDYLEIGLSYGQHETHKSLGINFTDVDVTMDIYPTVSASFNNVEITAEITCPSDWSVTSSDPAYKKSDASKMTLTFRLPADGKYSETHGIGRAMWAAAPSSNCAIEIISVSGTAIRN